MIENGISKKIKKNKYNILFFILLLAASLLYSYPQILSYRPYSIHQWRQCDCLSITKSYYNEKRSFFEPAVYWLGDGKEGKTVSEFPIIYFTVAKLWKIFGYHEYIFRLVNILIVFTGLFCLFRLAIDILKDGFWALFTTFLLFTSPILAYYTNNFLADAPAFGLALTGLYFYWKGVSKQNRVAYFISFVFFLLAGLIKISSLLSFCALLLIHIYLIITNKNENWWYYKLKYLIPYFILSGIVLVWVRYVVSYNSVNNSGIFLTDIYPIWKLDGEKIRYIWYCLRHELLPAYFNKKALLIVLALFIWGICMYKKANKNLLLFTSLVFAGVVTYSLLFFQAFTVHDYYLTNLLIFIPFPVIMALELLKRNYNTLFNKRILKAAALVLLLILTYETTAITRMKYSMSDKIVKTNIVIGTARTEYWKWYHWDYNNHMKAYETITPYLREIGIKNDDRVLSLPDNSINISLYLMDQKGFTGFGFGNLEVDKRIEMYKRNGVKYMVADTSFINKEQSFNPYIESKIGTYMNLNIYRLK